jgi:hypothetical protein
MSTESDTVANVPLARRAQWIFSIANWADDTGLPVVNPKITVLTDRIFNDFNPFKPATVPGGYEWSFNLNIPQGVMLSSSAGEENSLDYAKPGFSAARQITPEKLSGAVTIQTLDLMFRQEDPLSIYVNSVAIAFTVPSINFGQIPLVDYKVLSLNTVEDWTTGNNGWNINPSNLILGKTYHFLATLQATKSPDLAGSPISKPWILISQLHWDNFASVIGSSASVTHPGGPTFVASAQGTYEWQGSNSWSRQDFIFSQVVSEVVENPTPPPPYAVSIPVTFDLKPDSYNTQRQTDKVTGYIELPEGYSVRDIDVSTLRLAGVFPALAKPTEIGDYDHDGVPDLMVKFNVANAQFPPSSVRFIEQSVGFTGRLYDQTLLTGSDTIKLILK